MSSNTSKNQGIEIIASFDDRALALNGSARMKPLTMPVKPPMWGLVGLKASRADLRALFGEPHYVESDPRRTCGGEEDWWAFELPSGQRLMVGLDVAMGGAELFGDPAELAPILQSLGIAPDDARLTHHEPWEWK
jgi:hypothetical protein